MSASPPPQLPPKKSDVRPILLTLLFSFLLGSGSCFGFLTTLSVNKSSATNSAFAVLFMLCVAAFCGSLVILIVKAIVNR